MLYVPLALIGAIAALFFPGQYLSLPGSIGLIALYGVAVLNGMAMVSTI
jgi:cobalt-zinc-cadmium resistance protein CzcA